MRLYRQLLVVATLLAFGVILLGAYVRLSDAGLGCPDWPGCYGQLIGVPAAAHEQSAALQAFPGKPVEGHKAWKEMVHRYFAGGLGLLIALIALLAWRHHRALHQSPWLPSVLVGVVGVQALLGMWTVTLLLKPVIVSAHLLGGMMTLSLLVWLLLRQHHGGQLLFGGELRALRIHAALALFVVGVQIALGGWVSSNYAALACGDFPTCLGVWLPEMDFAQGFQMRRELGQSADGALLSNTALTAIHWSHRFGALIVTVIVGRLAWVLRRPEWRPWGRLLAAALLVQVGLGIANILLALPLPVAVAHNAGAAVLLSVTLAFNFQLWQASSHTA
ncbi:COX15/CtaA family protein [Propionivibrio sp.]|uniref:COX15/CtaA family protein n=1 Tax=Propionivibrio sp. TaxID=2212460 RepID=UPI00262CF803|nr:COX15/CtaA family protein [Propionivibrio sp.]